jgi:arylesterase/paraoxonase
MSGNKKRNVVLGVIGLLTLISFFVVRTLYASNTFATLSPAFAGTCQRVASPPGPEDIDLDRSTGIAYVSATDRRAIFSGEAGAPGDIFYLDLNNVALGFVDLGARHSEGLSGFNPHGISLYRGDDGRVTLMVVNHPNANLDTVEIFDLYEEAVDGVMVRQLVHRRTVTGELLISPNDLVAVGHDRFYATNDHGSKGGFGRTMEDYLRLNKSSVTYFDGDELSIVADGLTYANGITVSEDGSLVLVTETTDSSVRWYGRDIESGALTFTDKINVRTGVDNIDRAADGTYWIGAHAQVLKFSGHAGDATKLSPSHVIRLVPSDDGQGGQVEQIYLDLGDEISGSSVAVEHNGQMLIGQVFDDHILLCDLP